MVGSFLAESLTALAQGKMSSGLEGIACYGVKSDTRDHTELGDNGIPAQNMAAHDETQRIGHEE